MQKLLPAANPFYFFKLCGIKQSCFFFRQNKLTLKPTDLKPSLNIYAVEALNLWK
jgi:hypothetical protein